NGTRNGEVYCNECSTIFCEECRTNIHKRGVYKNHTFKKISEIKSEEHSFLDYIIKNGPFCVKCNKDANWLCKECGYCCDKCKENLHIVVCGEEGCLGVAGVYCNE